MKKKRDIKKLAIVGLSAGLILATHLSADDKNSSQSNDSNQTDPNNGNLGYHVMTEDELLLELSPEGLADYKSLTPEGKALALKVASMRCSGTNDCSGLNACETAKHTCAGQGSCKGTGKCAIADKNLAVKLVKNKMAKKRSGAASQQPK